MGYEVVKHVGSRAYRYRVESYRDAETKKVRSRWTYLGRATAPPASDPRISPDPDAQPVRRRRPSDSRARLIDAFEAVLEALPFERVTAAVVTAQAGLAHGTFYRYFADKRALLLAALERLQDEFARTVPSFAPPFADAVSERARVRRWVEATLRKPSTHMGLLRAYLGALERDAELRERRSARQLQRIAAFVAYLEALQVRGLIDVPRPAALADALLVLLDAAARASVAAGSAPDFSTVAGTCDVVERAIFARVEPPAPV